MNTATLLQALYARAHDAEELGLAAHRLLGHPPEDWPEFIDFFVVEWVDADGYTVVTRGVEDGTLPAEAMRISAEVRTALWVVDGWEGEVVLLRDLANDAEIAVWAPTQAKDLPKKTVLRARVVPEIAADDRFVFSGSPDLYDGLGVIGRLDLLRAWQESPAPDVHHALSALRAAFVQQREEQAEFVRVFGAEQVVFDGEVALATALGRFVHHLGNVARFGSLGGRTRAEVTRRQRGEEPQFTQVRLGESLRGTGRPGIVYDRIRGVHVLPRLGELLDGDAETRAFYLSEPGLAPFVRGWSGRAHPSTLPWDEGG